MERTPSRNRLTLLLVWALGTTFLSCVAWRGWLPQDDGMLAHSAERVLHGELPHRDFDAVYTGGLEFLHALAFKLFGISLASLRTMLLLVASLFIPVFFSLAARVLKPLWAGLVTATALVWSLPVYFAGLPSWYILFLSTFGLATLFRFFDTGHRRWLVATGALGGLAFLMKVNGLLFAIAVVLTLIFSEQSVTTTSSEPARRTPLSFVIWVGCAVLSLGLLGIVIRGPSLMAFTHYALPGLAIAATLALTERQIGSSDTRARLARWWNALAPFFLGLAIPIALFLIPYVVTNSLPSLYVGLFVLPARRITQVTSGFSPAWTLLWGAPLALLVGFGDRTPTARRLSAAVILGLALVPLALFGSVTFDYELVCNAARVIIPLASVAGATLLLRHASLSRERRRELFAVIATAAFVSLLQYPFPAYVYFCYVLPLGVLAMTYVVASQQSAPLPLFAVTGGFFAVFGALWVMPSSPTFVGTNPTRLPFIPFTAPRAGIEVPEVSDEYFEVIEEVEKHSAEGEAIYAAPDLPEIYFLTNRRNPTRTMYDLFDEDAGRPERLARILRTLREQHVKTVVLRQYPPFSPPISQSFYDALHREYPGQRQIGIFLVMWQP